MPPGEPIPVSCTRDCGGGCPLLAHVENGRLVRITNNPVGGEARFAACPAGLAMPRIVYAPNRLQKPLVRKGARGSGDFAECSWDEALSLVAERLTEIAERHGHQAVLSLGGSGSCRGAVHNTGRLQSRFLRTFGGHTGTHGSYSSAAASFVRPYLFGGEPAGLDAPTLVSSRLIVLWGLNPVDTRFGSNLESCLREARRRGASIVSVEPRKSRTVAHLADEWVPVLPGTDTALMLAVLHVLIEEGLVDRPFLDRCSVGFEELEAHVAGGSGEKARTPEWAETICGTPAGRIRDFARRYGKAKPAALLPGLSIQRNLGGEEAIRMAVALQAATGNTGALGGSSGSIAWGALPRPRCGAIPIPEAPAYPTIPVYRWPDAILEGRAGGYTADVRVVYNTGGNFLAQGADCRKSARAFEALDFAVCHEQFLTPTARFCDVVLPATTHLERADIAFPPTNHLFYSHRAVEPLHQSRNDYDIFCDLSDRLGFGEAFSENRTADEWIDHLLEGSEVEDPEAFKTTGFCDGGDHLRVGLSKFVYNPEGHPLPTPSGKIELASRSYGETGFPAWPTSRPMETSAAFPLRLFTPHPRYRIHSQGFGISWFDEKEPQELWIHPADAEARGIAHAEAVVVSSPTGRVRVPARVTGDVVRGAVCLVQGAWPRFDETGVDTAGAANVLTPTDPTLPSEGSRTHSVAVQVNRS